MNANKLKPGDTVTLYIPDRKDNQTNRVVIKKAVMQAIEFYEHFILLQTAAGYRTCYSYWETQRLMHNNGGCK